MIWYVHVDDDLCHGINFSYPLQPEDSSSDEEDAKEGDKQEKKGKKMMEIASW